MNEEAIANLIVHLTGDGAGFQKMLDAAMEQTKGFVATVTRSLASLAEFAGFRDSLNAFTDFQDNLVRIETTVEANGLAVEATMKKYAAFADEIERTTRVSSVAATDLLAVASSFDLVGDKAQRAVRLAIGISQGRKGVAPQEVIRALSMFWRTSEVTVGQGGGGSNIGIMYLARILGLYGRGMGGRGGGRGGEGGAETQKKMIEEINKQLHIAETTSEKLGGNFGGQLARIKSYLQDIGVDLGGIVAKWLDPFVEQLSKAVRWFKELNPEIKKIVAVFLSLSAILVAGGPIVSFFKLLLRLAGSLTPITAALTAATLATAGWVQSVGGLSAAWEIVRKKFLEFARVGLHWLEGFIVANKRLVLAVGLVAGAIAVVVAAWRMARAALVSIDGILTVLYIKQLAQRSALLALAAASFTLRAALTAVAAVWSSAAWTAGILFTLGKIALLATAYYIYYAALFAGKAALLAFNAVAAVAGFILGGITGIVTGAATLWLAWSASIWTANTALAFAVGTVAAFNVVLAGVASWIGVVAALFAGAFTTAWVSGKAAATGFLDVLLAIPGRSGPLAHIGGLFREWFSILADVYRAVTLLPGAIDQTAAAALGLKKNLSGMDLAWQLLLAGFDLAKEQLRAAWPPLWRFIQTTALAAWAVIQAGWEAFVASILPPFKLAFSKLALYIQYTLQRAMMEFFRSIIPRGAAGLLTPIARALRDFAVDAERGAFKEALRLKSEMEKKGYTGMAEDQKKAAAAIAKMNAELQKQQAIVAAAAKQFNVPETQAVKDARQRVAELKKLIQQATAKQQNARKDLDLGAPFRQAEKEIKKWEATLYGSAEAYSKISEYFDKLDEQREQQTKLGLAGPAAVGGSAAVPVPVPNPTPSAASGGKIDIGPLLKELQDANELLRDFRKNGWPVKISGFKLTNLGKP